MTNNLLQFLILKKFIECKPCFSSTNSLPEFNKDKEIHKINVIFAIKYKTKTAAYLQNITQKFI